MTKTEVDRLGHAARGGTVRRRVTRNQISFYFVIGPGSYSGLLVGRDVVGLPAVDDAPAYFMLLFVANMKLRGV